MFLYITKLGKLLKKIIAHSPLRWTSWGVRKHEGDNMDCFVQISSDNEHYQVWQFITYYFFWVGLCLVWIGLIWVREYVMDYQQDSLVQATSFTGYYYQPGSEGELGRFHHEASSIVTKKKKRKWCWIRPRLMNTKPFVIDSLFLIFPFHTNDLASQITFPFGNNFTNFFNIKQFD